jgi:NAD(P)-dependent dehydrogenase (short-subunit alcohol dehydrogenase family)
VERLSPDCGGVAVALAFAGTMTRLTPLPTPHTTGANQGRHHVQRPVLTQRPRCARDGRLARHRQDDRGGLSQRRRGKGLHHRAQGRPCEETAKALTAQYDGECIALPIDISTVAGAELLASEYNKREPKLDILVNNAGAAWGADFDEFPESGWDKVMNLNVKAPFFLTKALAPTLRASASAERPAKVINIASIDGIFVNPGETYSYAASKAGLIHLTRRMAVKLTPDHIVVTAIAPGPFKSDMNRAARDHADEVATRVPVGRIGTDEDMAGAAIYLASRAGDYVVGATIAVDGGIVYANPGIKGSGWDSD